jgi:carboxyl-terminal processing protease
VKNIRVGNWVSGWGRWARQITLVFLLLALIVHPGPAADTAPSCYDSLRLFADALSEISQKYVHTKSDEEMLNGAIRGMMNSLDPDSSFLSAKEYQGLTREQNGQPAEAGVELIIKDNLLTVVSVLDGSGADTAGLKPGDHILKIDGHMVRNLTTQEAAAKFRGASGTSLKVQMIRNGALKPKDLTVILQPLAPGTVTSQVVGDSYGYVRVRFFNDNTPIELEKTLKSLEKQGPPLRGLILDLRNNARGSMEQAVRSASLLLGDKEIVSAKGRNAASQETFRGKERDLSFKVPLPTVVLLDQGTARGAEILAAALHDQYRATLLGAKSQGLCGLTKVLPLPDGSALVMTVALCYTPGGHKIQGKGLEPDIQGQTPKDKGKDQEAEAAALPKTPPPDQDPWVLQAMEVLKGGKKGQVARKAEG